MKENPDSRTYLTELWIGGGILAFSARLHHPWKGLHVTSCLSVVGQLYHSERRIRIIEPDAILVIMLIVAALGLVYANG
jgi:hypothetical protein